MRYYGEKEYFNERLIEVNTGHWSIDLCHTIVANLINAESNNILSNELRTFVHIIHIYIHIFETKKIISISLIGTHLLCYSILLAQ